MHNLKRETRVISTLIVNLKKTFFSNDEVVREEGIISVPGGPMNAFIRGHNNRLGVLTALVFPL